MELTSSLLVLPLIAALIGWLTNFLAVKMLFHPKNEIRFLFISFHGVFPKRQSALAKKLGVVVSKELFSAHDVAEKLKDGAHSSKVQLVLKKGIHKFISKTLPEKIPMLAMFLKPEHSEKIEDLLIDSITPLIDEVIDSLGEEVVSSLDVQEIVEQRVSAFSGDKLEEMLFAIMKREFRFIEVLGGVLGFFIGLVQLFLVQYLI